MWPTEITSKTLKYFDPHVARADPRESLRVAGNKIFPDYVFRELLELDLLPAAEYFRFIIPVAELEKAVYSLPGVVFRCASLFFCGDFINRMVS